ncbi:hypothetical protein [Pseudobacteriovorax antillogorgiicola]|uniref:hypothetical protein n=1 Tax=Pseudobacteriovorax antillogorgiicola TaxID=1513793 RepID=UPI001048D73F|nr:hypothetical protein [Pseudobacteriovorax antillogorgiicola]
MKKMHLLVVMLIAWTMVSCKDQSVEPSSKDSDESSTSTRLQEAWQNSLSSDEKDLLSSALEGVSKDLIKGELNGQIIPISVEANQLHLREGHDDDIVITFKRQDLLHYPLMLSMRIHKDSKAGTDDVVLEPSKNILFGKDQDQVEIVLPLKDDYQVEAREILLLEFKAPTYMELSETSLAFVIDDNDQVDTRQGLAFELKADEESQSFKDHGPENLIVLSEGGSPQFQASTKGRQGRLAFDGKADILTVLDDSVLNSADHYLAKTMIVGFHTGADVQRRQVIFEQGSILRGINIYIDHGQLFLGAYNLANDDAGASTPWAPTHIQTGIVPNAEYLAVIELNANAKTLSAWLNRHELGAQHGVGKLFGHQGGIGIGGAHQEITFHDGAAKIKNGYFFQGQVAYIAAYNRLLNENERVSIENKLWQETMISDKKNTLFTHLKDVTIKEGEREKIAMELELQFPPRKPLVVRTKIGGHPSAEQEVSVPKEIQIAKHQMRVPFSIEVQDNSRPEFEKHVAIEFMTDEGLTPISSLNLRIIDDESFKETTPAAHWLSVSDDGLVNHGASPLTLKPKPKLEKPQPVMDKEGYLAHLQFQGNQVLSFQESKILNRDSYYRTKTLAFAIKTGEDVQGRQMIYKQGDHLRGLNIYIHQGMIYLMVFNQKKLRYHKAWGKHYLSYPIEPNHNYTVVFAFDSDKNRLLAFINEQFIENTQAEIGPLPRHKGSIDLGGLTGPTSFHDTDALVPSFFKGRISEIFHYNTFLNDEELDSLSQYLINKYRRDRLAARR